MQKQGVIISTTFSVINKVWKSRLSSINKTFKVNENCIQCGICIRTYPSKNIKLQNNKLEWDKKCRDCMVCVQSCQYKVIYFNSRTKNKRRYRNINI